jgi:hypothetical protein
MDAAETVIACDESGAEDDCVYDSEHRVFVHASVDLTLDEAAGVIAEVQRLAPNQASEYKSRQLLRPGRQKALDWLLAEDGVLVGRARAFVVDKDYFVVAKIVDMLVEEVAHEPGVDLYANDQARTFARTLYRQGQRALGTADWSALVAGFNSLIRSKQRKSGQCQAVEATVSVSSLVKTSRGVRNPSTARGRSLSSSAMASR